MTLRLSKYYYKTNLRRKSALLRVCDHLRVTHPFSFMDAPKTIRAYETYALKNPNISTLESQFLTLTFIYCL